MNLITCLVLCFVLILGLINVNVTSALPYGVYRNSINSPGSNFYSRSNVTSFGPRANENFIVNNPPRLEFENRPKVCSDCRCGIGRQSRIVGGEEAVITDYPWMVGITNEGRFHCGGSLITSRHVLTAAHCLSGFDKKHFVLTFGTDNLSIKTQTAIYRRVKNWSIHEDYNNPHLNNDIAIIEIDRPFDFKNNRVVIPLCLPDNQAIDYTGSLATVIGWGNTVEKGEVSPILRKVSLPIMSDEECDEAGYPKGRRTENMFCAGYLDGERDACSGDSGGPLMVRGPNTHLEIYGITSFGRGCARPQFPGIYTKVINYLGWIANKLKGECVCSTH